MSYNTEQQVPFGLVAGNAGSGVRALSFFSGYGVGVRVSTTNKNRHPVANDYELKLTRAAKKERTFFVCVFWLVYLTKFDYDRPSSSRTS